jgi:hypothetical protein
VKEDHEEGCEPDDGLGSGFIFSKKPRHLHNSPHGTHFIHGLVTCTVLEKTVRQGEQLQITVLNQWVPWRKS